MTYQMLRGVLFVAALATFGRAAAGHATPCKADGLSCSTNQSCCGRLCYNSAPPGKRAKGVCCTPTTCALQGAQCGTIPNGTCAGIVNLTLDCGTCPAGQVCTGNVCVTTTTTTTTTSSTVTTTTLCTPLTHADCGPIQCGRIDDRCGGTVTCGPQCECSFRCNDGQNGVAPITFTELTQCVASCPIQCDDECNDGISTTGCDDYVCGPQPG